MKRPSFMNPEYHGQFGENEFEIDMAKYQEFVEESARELRRVLKIAFDLSQDPDASDMSVNEFLADADNILKKTEGL